MYTDKRGIAALAAMMACLAAPALAEDSTPASAEATPALAPAPADTARPVAEAPRPPPEARPSQGTSRRAAEGGFTLGLRLGFGLPLGDAMYAAGQGRNVKLADYVGSSLPVWVEPGFRVSRNLVLGGYFQYAFGNGTKVAGTSCQDALGVSCSSSLLRVGLELIWRPSPDSSFSPWFGIGAGYERLTLHFGDQGGGVGSWLSGWELLNVQLGVDRAVSDVFAIGPFVTASAGRFGSAGTSYDEQEGSSDAQDLQNLTTHFWLTFGVKGTFDF